MAAPAPAAPAGDEHRMAEERRETLKKKMEDEKAKKEDKARKRVRGLF